MVSVASTHQVLSQGGTHGGPDVVGDHPYLSAEGVFTSHLATGSRTQERLFAPQGLTDPLGAEGGSVLVDLLGSRHYSPSKVPSVRALLVVISSEYRFRQTNPSSAALPRIVIAPMVNTWPSVEWVCLNPG